jgi:lysozyme
MITENVRVVDLSSYQHGFNFQEFKRSGGLAEILKTTEGQTRADASYKTFRREALAAGLRVASYHFLRALSVSAQAEFYLEHARPARGERVVCDWEDERTTVDHCVGFLQHIRRERPDLLLTVYSGNVAKEKLNGVHEWLRANTSLWLAQYGPKPSLGNLQKTWPAWSLWQFSDGHGHIDQNRFNGTDEQLLKWFGPVEAAAPAEPTSEPVRPVGEAA